MKERSTIPALFMAACAILAIAWAAPARPAGLDDSIILIAKRQLQDKLYSSTILLARPIGGGRHVGFIINKPTQVTLGKLFPTHEPSRSCRPCVPGRPGEPGSHLRARPGQEQPGRRSIRILDDLYLAIDSDVVDRVIEKQSSHALLRRHGAVASRRASGRSEARIVVPARRRADLVLRKPTDSMYEELVGRSERKANAI